MPFKLSTRSKAKLSGVHPALVSVVERAIQITPVDFVVLEGLRTYKRQEELFKAGASRTLRSRHLTGHAVDLGAWLDHEVRWDWPLYFQIAEAMKQAARDLNVQIVWGGDWETFKDGPHFQLSHTMYPAKVDHL